MSKDTKNRISETNREYAKKERKRVVIPFVLCLLIAIVVWLYATANGDDKKTEGKEAVQSKDSVVMIDSDDVVAL